MFALIFLSYSILNIVKPNFYENMPHSISINRITTEYKQLQKDPEEYFVARPLEDNLFEWHFVFKGIICRFHKQALQIQIIQQVYITEN